MTLGEYAVQRNIWHWYTLNGVERYFRIQIDFLSGEYHGIVKSTTDPNKQSLRLIGYTSDSTYDNYSQLAKQANKINRANKGEPLKKQPSMKTKALRTGVVCCYCEETLTHQNFTREHLIPISKGGNSRMENLRPACVACNRERSSMTMIEYIVFLMDKPQDARTKKAIENAYEIEKYIIANQNKLLKK